MRNLVGSVYLKAVFASCITFASLHAHSAVFTPGDLVVQSQHAGSISQQIREYNSVGAVTQTLVTPQPPGQNDLYNPRDMTFDNRGNMYVFNGSFNPYLSTYNSSSGRWSHVTTPGWSLVNNVSYGGIAAYGNNVFVGSITNSSHNPNGIFAFNTVDGTVTHFGEVSDQWGPAQDFGPRDLTIGLDGQLYAMTSSMISIYDPITFNLKNSLALTGGGDFRTMAVDKSGNIYAGTWEGKLNKYDSNGVFLQSINAPDSAIDLDIRADGLLALGTRDAGVFITDTNFSFTYQLQDGNYSWNSFVSFVPAAVPVPAAAWLFGSGLVGLIGAARRRKVA